MIRAPPATYNRNQSREPIDDIWATRGITITRSGYLAFSEGCPSDHRVLWFDASYSVALGQRPPAMAPLQPKRLKAKYPRLANKYITRVKTRQQSSGFKDRFEAFQLQETITWSPLLQLEFNKLQREDTAIRLSVEG
jgi:hypothetical protein